MHRHDIRTSVVTAMAPDSVIKACGRRWESSESKAAVWCLISRMLGGGGRRKEREGGGGEGVRVTERGMRGRK